jgi:hypothetical protein
MENQKEDFLKNRFVDLLRQIPSDMLPHWGKMSLQQMVEHFTATLKIASGKTPQQKLHPQSTEQLEKAHAFLMSDKPFKENTPNPLLPEVPAPVRNKTLKEALNELQKEIDYFFLVFNKNEHLLTRHFYFGDLNYQMNVQLLYKHALHHLRQFGVQLQP